MCSSRFPAVLSPLGCDCTLLWEHASATAARNGRLEAVLDARDGNRTVDAAPFAPRHLMAVGRHDRFAAEVGDERRARTGGSRVDRIAPFGPHEERKIDDVIRCGAG